MSSDHRKDVRRSVHQGARIVAVDGSPLCPCIMVDVSGSGARLLLPNSDVMPGAFVLLLSHDGELRRQCSLVWQLENSIGVRFESGPVRPSARQ